MKRTLFVIFLCTSFNLFAHEKNVHQYIVLEAYKILVKHYTMAGGDINEIKAAFDKQFFQTDGTPIKNLFTDVKKESNYYLGITSGSWDEDDHDLCYADINHPLPVAPAVRTHFWVADEGTEQTNDFLANYNIANSWTKARHFLFYYQNRGAEITYLKSLSEVWYCLTKSSLLELYSNQKCDCYDRWGNGHDNTILRDNYGRAYAFDFLGHIAHLLADMSMPSHVLMDLHPDVNRNSKDWNEDPYEIWMQSNAENTFGDFDAANNKIDGDDGFMPHLVEMNDQDAMFYLFYTMNQLASHFSSKDEVGNDSLPLGTNDVINQKYAAWGDVPTSVNNIDIANKTFNYCIGATASLFYWFGIRTGLLKTKINHLYFNKKVQNPTFLVKSTNAITFLPGFSFSSNGSNSSLITKIVNENEVDFRTGSPLVKSAKIEDTFNELKINIESVSINNSVSVYPNPNNGKFTIQVKNNSIKEIIITNNLGQTVKNLKNNNSLSGTHEIVISSAMKGIYFLRYIVDNKILTQKVIVE